jgi:hypothetical protein
MVSLGAGFWHSICCFAQLGFTLSKPLGALGLDREREIRETACHISFIMPEEATRIAVAN